ncbi:MAG: hypothetical protein FWF59_11680 [Turicibacter sp.]|nr:hypothetical protein [Turicibacter sp.]
MANRVLAPTNLRNIRASASGSARIVGSLNAGQRAVSLQVSTVTVNNATTTAGNLGHRRTVEGWHRIGSPHVAGWVLVGLTTQELRQFHNPVQGAWLEWVSIEGTNLVPVTTVQGGGM